MAGDPKQLRTPRRKQEEGMRAIPEPVPAFSESRPQGEIRAASLSFWEIRAFPGVSTPFGGEGAAGRVGILQIGRVKAFSEPAVDRCKQFYSPRALAASGP